MGVCLIATGGTIASLRDPQTGAVRPAVGGDELVATVPGVKEAGLTQVEELAKVNGWNIDPELILSLAGRIKQRLAQLDIDGVVVTHGTDTVEETAFACDLMTKSDKPVAFAAAMRSGDELSADGPRNLLNAVRVAGSPDAHGLGAVLVMNDEVHAARWVRKVDSSQVNAFASPGRHPVALLLPRGLTVLHRPQRVTLTPPKALDRQVVVLQTFIGMPADLPSKIVEATGADGVILEGTGLGNLPGSAMEGAKGLIDQGIPVIVATRVVKGGTSPVYGGPGGGATLRDMGLIEARHLSAAKARLLLMILLANGLKGRELSTMFTQTAAELA
jgi:L-asparaginase